MTAKCIRCGDVLDDVLSKHSANRHVCLNCVHEVTEEMLRDFPKKKVAAAAKRLGEAIKKYGVNVGETNVKD